MIHVLWSTEVDCQISSWNSQVPLIYCPMSENISLNYCRRKAVLVIYQYLWDIRIFRFCIWCIWIFLVTIVSWTGALTGPIITHLSWLCYVWGPVVLLFSLCPVADCVFSSWGGSVFCCSMLCELHFCRSVPAAPSCPLCSPTTPPPPPLPPPLLPALLDSQLTCLPSRLIT